MPDIVIELAARARELAPKDRERLVDMLLDSFHESSDPSVEEAWRLEVSKRITAHKRGDAALHDEAEVMAEAKQIAP